jgi:hypothetical protein
VAALGHTHVEFKELTKESSRIIPAICSIITSRTSIHHLRLILSSATTSFHFMRAAASLGLRARVDLEYLNICVLCGAAWDRRESCLGAYLSTKRCSRSGLHVNRVGVMVLPSANQSRLATVQFSILSSPILHLIECVTSLFVFSDIYISFPRPLNTQWLIISTASVLVLTSQIDTLVSSVILPVQHPLRLTPYQPTPNRVGDWGGE